MGSEADGSGGATLPLLNLRKVGALPHLHRDTGWLSLKPTAAVDTGERADPGPE